MTPCKYNCGRHTASDDGVCPHCYLDVVVGHVDDNETPLSGALTAFTLEANRQAGPVPLTPPACREGG